MQLRQEPTGQFMVWLQSSNNNNVFHLYKLNFRIEVPLVLDQLEKINKYEVEVTCQAHIFDKNVKIAISFHCLPIYGIYQKRVYQHGFTEGIFYIILRFCTALHNLLGYRFFVCRSPFPNIYC